MKRDLSPGAPDYYKKTKRTEVFLKQRQELISQLEGLEQKIKEKETENPITTKKVRSVDGTFFTVRDYEDRYSADWDHPLYQALKHANT